MNAETEISLDANTKLSESGASQNIAFACFDYCHEYITFLYSALPVHSHSVSTVLSHNKVSKLLEFNVSPTTQEHLGRKT